MRRKKHIICAIYLWSSFEKTGEAKGSEGATEDTGGGTKEDTGCTSQNSAKQESDNQPKNEEEAEGCCCVII